jgi:hypothetical protein
MADVMARLAGPANAGSGTSTVFTGTSGHTYSIRSIRIVNNTSAPITYKLGIGGVTDALLVLPAIAVQAGSAYHEDALFVLSGTETLQVNASATGGTITVCGLDQS